MNSNEVKMQKPYEVYFLLYEAEQIEDDDVWVGIYTDVKLLITEYKTLVKKKCLDMPLRIYGFGLNVHDENPNALSIEALKMLHKIKK